MKNYYQIKQLRLMIQIFIDGKKNEEYSITSPNQKIQPVYFAERVVTTQTSVLCQKDIDSGWAFIRRCQDLLGEFGFDVYWHEFTYFCNREVVEGEDVPLLFDLKKDVSEIEVKLYQTTISDESLIDTSYVDAELKPTRFIDNRRFEPGEFAEVILPYSDDKGLISTPMLISMSPDLYYGAKAYYGYVYHQKCFGHLVGACLLPHKPALHKRFQKAIHRLAEGEEIDDLIAEEKEDREKNNPFLAELMEKLGWDEIKMDF